MNRTVIGTFGLTLTIVGSIAFCAQPTQPANDNGNAPAQSENWAGDAYRGYNDYPATEVQAVPVARAQAARARAEQDLAQLQLRRWVDRAWDDFTHSKDYSDAAAAEKKAYEEYLRERDRVLRRLSSDTTYRAMVDLIADLRSKIDRQSNGRSATFDEIEQTIALATVKLGYASTVSAMEAAALSADQAVQDARNRLVQAGTRTRELRTAFARSVPRDPQFLAARDNFDQLRVTRIVADNFLEGAINAREIALDYAYMLHGYDQYRYSVYGIYGYGYYGYGYGGYGGPYMRRY